MLSLLLILIIIGVITEVISLLRNLNKIDFDYVVYPKLKEAGEPIIIQSIISNTGLLPISYFAVREIYPTLSSIPYDVKNHNRDDLKTHAKIDGIYVKFVNRIGGRQAKKFSFETSINKRGVYTFTAESLEVGDFLGLKDKIKDIRISKEVVIYPKRYECADLNDTLSNIHGDIVSKRYLIRDPIITVGLREYTGREPIKDIHWLQSAKKAELMVREYDYNRQLSVNILLYVNPTQFDSSVYEKLDKNCAVARTVCESFASKNIPSLFFTNAYLTRKPEYEIWKCDVTAGNIDLLLEGLGRVINHARSSLEQLLNYVHRVSDLNSITIIIMDNRTADNTEIIDKFKHVTGREIVLINEVGSV